MSRILVGFSRTLTGARKIKKTISAPYQARVKGNRARGITYEITKAKGGYRIDKVRK